MNSKILQSLGLGSLDIGYIFIALLALIIILIIIVIMLLKKTNSLKERLDKFTTGKDGKSLEKDIAALYEDNKFLKVNLDKDKKDIRNLYKKLRYTFQKVGIVKYDAFKQMGGKLSFSLAMLDENNNGFIMNSVHSTDGCYTYTKIVKNGECDLELGTEEAKALQMALGTGENK